MYKYLSCYISCASIIFAEGGYERIDAYNVSNTFELRYNDFLEKWIVLFSNVCIGIRKAILVKNLRDIK